jgi:hypothetical protein
MILENREDTSHLIAIDRRSHLEVSDPKHRYGKNLRTYYDEWVRLGLGAALDAYRDEPVSPSQELAGYEAFFLWLDNPHGLPELAHCPRTVLDGDTVTYCRAMADRWRYAVVFDSRGRLHRLRRQSSYGSERSLDSNADDAEYGEHSLISTGKSGHIFVVKDGVLYTHTKKIDQPPRFHHSSFFAGDVVEAAGILVCESGANLVLYPHSGHYRPKDKHFLNLLTMLKHNHVRLASVTVDVQRTLRTARLLLPGGEKTRKKDTAWMWSAVALFDFLTVKVGAWDRGMFAELIQRVVNRTFLSSAGMVHRLSGIDARDKAAWDSALQALSSRSVGCPEAGPGQGQGQGQPMPRHGSEQLDLVEVDGIEQLEYPSYHPLAASRSLSQQDSKVDVCACSLS